ncbi:MAG: glycerophosphodiester phosphodiesterase [Deltaproteobacteria bacterium]|nr:glycerophosphodiester phosphodiesterase [Deltaproteobacteria bacterium]
MRKALDTDFFSAPSPRVMAHRGASAEYPENTIPAFRAAAETQAVDYIELDVHCTRDGHVVVVHDEGLSRIASDDRLIAEMTMAEIDTVDAGFNFSVNGDWPFRAKMVRVPKLEEVLKSWPAMRFIIELKPRDPAIADAALEVVRATGMGRQVLFASEHVAPIARVRMLAPEIPSNLPAPEIAAFIQALRSSKRYAGDGDALQIPPEYRGIKLATREVVAAAHLNDLEVHVWTVNDQAQMEELLSLGVDGIITDHPSRLVALLRSHRQRD